MQHKGILSTKPPEDCLTGRSFSSTESSALVQPYAYCSLDKGVARAKGGGGYCSLDKAVDTQVQKEKTAW